MVKVLSFRVPNLTPDNIRTSADLRALTRPGSRLYDFAKGDPSVIEQQLERPVLRQFEEQSLPRLSQQYTGAGLLGSSAYANAVASAQGRLQENLVANRENVRGRAFNQLLQADQLLFQNPDFTYRHVVKKKRSFFQRLLGIGSSIALGAIGGGIAGALTGGISGIGGGIRAGITAGASGGASNIFSDASPFTPLADSSPGQGVTSPGVPQTPSPSFATTSDTLRQFENIATGETPVTGGGLASLGENDPRAIEGRKARSGRRTNRNLSLAGV